MTQSITFEFENDVWLYTTEKASWHFITLPVSLSKEIKDIIGDQTKGWGSIPVEVCIGNTNWKTSIFPDKKLNSYVLPLKASVRKSEQILNKQLIQVAITIEF